MPRTRKVLQFRVTLQDIEPAIWRLIQVPETYSFWDLHVAIQDAMGWLDYHLHSFRITDPIDGSEVEIGIPDYEGIADQEYLPGWEIPLAKCFLSPGDEALYEYDFGDGWEHTVVLEAVVDRISRKRYPVCVAGARACPPEDCGGVPGYERLLEIMQDPNHQEYKEMLEWLGRRFEPEVFSPEKVKFDNPEKRWNAAFAAD